MLGSGRGRDARITAQYLDALLSADAERDADVPADAALQAPVRLAARRLRADLIRFHPSFRFQEALAARLALEAERMRLGLPPSEGGASGVDGAAGVGGAAGVDGAAGAAGAAIDAGVILQFPLDSSAGPDDEIQRPARDARPFIVGGVGVASAALSIGAAYVAWRWARPSGNTMTRAVRAAHAAQAAATHAAAGRAPLARVAAAATTVASAAAGAAAASAGAAAGATVNGAAATTGVLTAAASSASESRASARRAARERGRSVLQGLFGVVA